MNVSVVIPTYNRADSLRFTLEALSAQNVPEDVRWELIVVDNNSSDDTRAVVSATRTNSPVPVHYVFEPRQGVSHARNAGIDHAKGAIIAFTDDDVLPAPNWVAALTHAIQQRGVDIVGGRILPRWPAPVPKWIETSNVLLYRLTVMTHDAVARITPNLPMPAVWGANMAFRREVFDTGRRFDPALGMVGDKLYRGEECHLIGSLLSTGHTVVYDPTLLVWHRIQPDRMRRGYFRRQSFQIGEGEGRVFNLASKRQLLGAPVFYYRWAAAALASWISAALFRRRDAFERQLIVLEALGRLWARWKWYVSTRREERS